MLTVFAFQAAFAQIEITGKIIDSYNLPVYGATITYTETNTETNTGTNRKTIL